MQPSMTLIIKPFAAILLQLTLYVIVGNIAFMQQIHSLVIEHSTIYIPIKMSTCGGGLATFGLCHLMDLAEADIVRRICPRFV